MSETNCGERGETITSSRCLKPAVGFQQEQTNSSYVNKMAHKFSSYPAICRPQRQDESKIPADFHFRTFRWWLCICPSDWQTNRTATSQLHSAGGLYCPTPYMSLLSFQCSRYYHKSGTRVCRPQSRVCERDLLNGKDAGSGGERDREEEREGEWRSWEKKLSLVNLITLVTVCPGQTQQPNTLHLKHKQCKPQQNTHKRKNQPSLLDFHRAHSQTTETRLLVWF